jgi:hypothetical protein
MLGKPSCIDNDEPTLRHDQLVQTCHGSLGLVLALRCELPNFVGCKQEGEEFDEKEYCSVRS